jgi:hypothetical protein
MVHHPSPAGNGVRLTVTSNQQGQTGQWTVAHKKQEINLPARQVQKDEEICFVLDMNGQLTSDNFNWSFIIKHVDKEGQLVRSWDSIGGFHGPLDAKDLKSDNDHRLAIVDLCHVLLSSNEFSYVD